MAMMSTFYVCYGSTGDEPIYEHASSLLKPSPEMEVHYQGPELGVECVVLDDWCHQNGVDHIDYLRLDVQGSELQVLQSSPQILSGVKVIDVATNFFPFRIGTTMYQDLNEFLTTSGFTLISHCYREKLEGNALYINDHFFDDGSLDRSKYQKCYVKGLDAYFYVDEIPDGIKSFLKDGVYWEGTIGNLIKKYVKEGSTAVDVGAHIGIHTIAMSRKAGPQGQVVAFEPQKKMYAEQLLNLKINHCNNVVSIPKALGESSKTIQMNPRNPVNEGGTSIGEGGDFVEMITLDSLNLQNVSLIKVDVEHYEYFVFKGAKETILRNRPVIIFEIMGNFDYKTSPDEVKSQFDRVSALVESYGYKVFQIFGNDHIAFPLERLTF
jgi:FkbM family methyltransferase